MTDIVIKDIRRTGKHYPPPAEALSPEDAARPSFPNLDQDDLIRDALASIDRAYIILSELLERKLKLKNEPSNHGRPGQSRE